MRLPKDWIVGVIVMTVYATDRPHDPWSGVLRRGSFGGAAFAAANLCRIGNRPPAGEKMGKKMPATIWHGGANEDKAQSSSTRAEGGMHDCSDVDAPPTSNTAFPGLTGSAPLLLSIERCALRFIRRSWSARGRHFRVAFFKIKNAGRPAFLQDI
jgi:hypothetical protein